MARLTRAQQQERTRAAVLTAAREEFAERGFLDAKVDRIAERASLTRGAVYSNFPSKRALYLAVLLRSAGSAGHDDAAVSHGDLGAAVGAFARVWLERLPLSGETPSEARLRVRSLSGVLDGGSGAAALAGVVRLEAVLLGLALEAAEAPGGSALGRSARRRVRLAELVLTLLAGAAGIAETSPGAGDPFDVVRAAEHLAGLDLVDAWDPPHRPFVGPALVVDDPWPFGPHEADPVAGGDLLSAGSAGDDLLPAGSAGGDLLSAGPAGDDLLSGEPAGWDGGDLLSGAPVSLGGDGVVSVLGTARLGAAEEAVRSGRPATIVVVTGEPAELGALVRLRVGDLAHCLRRAGLAAGLRLVLDGDGSLAGALGIAAGDGTEAALLVRGGRVVARADGRGAALSVTLGDDR